MSSATATPHGLACLTITHAGSVEAVDQPPRRLGVVQVEVAQRLAAVLHGVVPPAAGAARAGSGRRPGAGSRRSAAAGRSSRSRCSVGGRRSVGVVGRRRRASRRSSASYVGGAGERGAGQAAPGRRRRATPPARSSLEHRPRSRPGSTTTPTWAWFFAAARTIAGPPMSISSMLGIAGERVEVDDDEVDRLDAVLVEVGGDRGRRGRRAARRGPSGAGSRRGGRGSPGSR